MCMQYVWCIQLLVHTSKVILSPGIPVNVHECLGLNHYRSGHALGDVSTNLFVHSLPPLHAHTTHTHVHTHTHTHDYTLSWGRLPFTLQYERNMRILLTNCWRPMLTQTCQWRWSTHTTHSSYVTWPRLYIYTSNELTHDLTIFMMSGCVFSAPRQLASY